MYMLDIKMFVKNKKELKTSTMNGQTMIDMP